MNSTPQLCLCIQKSSLINPPPLAALAPGMVIFSLMCALAQTQDNNNAGVSVIEMGTKKSRSLTYPIAPWQLLLTYNGSF
jgi:hypothetical protein